MPMLELETMLCELDSHLATCVSIGQQPSMPLIGSGYKILSPLLTTWHKVPELVWS